MPLIWKLSELFQGQSMKSRHRRRAKYSRLVVESLESRVVPTATGAPTGAVTGTAFLDGNSNHTRESGEIIAKGVTVHLTGTSDAMETVNSQTTTDQQGRFSFTLVPMGTYSLTADVNSTVTGSTSSVMVMVGNTSVPQDLPVGAVLAPLWSAALFLNTSPPISSSNHFTFPTAGTGQTTAINLAPTLRNGQPANISVAQNATPTTVDLAGIFDDPNLATSQVQIQTNNGNVNVNLFDKDAPQTVQNFYNYVNSGAYNNSIFHRLAITPAAGTTPATPFVLQGGGFKYTPTVAANPPVAAVPASITAIPTDPPVQNEFDGINRSNLVDTVAMAKMGNNPNSATNQFFFNLGDNHANLDAQNGGFTVFGQLVGPTDHTVVNNLASTTVKDESAAAGITDATVRGALNAIPLKNYTGTTFPTDTTAANFLEITGVTTIVRDEVLTYSVFHNSNTNLVTATIINNRLTLTYITNQTGSADIVVRATDKQGATFDATLHLIVNAPSGT